ncbi:MAG: tRNA (guanosine(37)-N1)-methyltransferase TrmD [Mycoplasma sp.]
MKITILTLFDDVYNSFINSSIIKKAVDQKYVEIEVINFRDYSNDKHKRVDDYQCGGGPGMVIGLQSITEAIKNHRTSNSHVLLTSPSGKLLKQDMLEQLKTKEHLILIAGHYEGFDARIENYIDDSVSIGDYVLTGGELPTLVMMDAIIRLIPGVINKDSLIDESFNNNLLDYPVYTKPISFEGFDVPEVLLSGNHKEINKFRLESQIELTKKKRPDLYETYLKKGQKNESK